MSDGFLGYDTSFMLDVVACTLVLVVPALCYSLFLVKKRQAYARHRRLQIVLGLVLLLAVTAFEVDLQIVHGGWLNVANKLPEAPRLSGDRLLAAQRVLRVHLVFAVSTPVLWAVTTGLALRNYSNPARPGPHSRVHNSLGWLSVVDLVLTSVTGLAFYYFAFVAK
jgi:putative membrane protein